MTEEKKRSWQPLCVVAVLLLLAGLCTSIAEMGRRGTLVGRYERIHERMPESEALSILGRPLTATESCSIDRSLLRPEVLPPVSFAVSNSRLGDYFWELENWPPVPAFLPSAAITKSYTWRDGPAEARLIMMRERGGRYQGDWSDKWVVGQTELQVDSMPFGLWRIRRWAEQAYTAIHGPRR